MPSRALVTIKCSDSGADGIAPTEGDSEVVPNVDDPAGDVVAVGSVVAANVGDVVACDVISGGMDDGPRATSRRLV
jgi:hypothetical protein